MKVIVSNDVELFVDSLDEGTSGKVWRLLSFLREYGTAIGMPHSRSLGDGIFELRARGKREVRLLYGYRYDGAIVVCGFIKKTQKTPVAEIEKAVQRLQAW